MDVKAQLKSVFEALTRKRALIHHITNYVTVNDCANVVLAIGASPIMADEAKEVEAMVALCDALVLNIGTANERTVQSMLLAAKAANEKGIPIVLDPVGIGAISFRYESVAKVLDTAKMSVIRGNMAEIKTIAGLEAKSSGVDSLDEEEEGVNIATRLAEHLGCTIAITGKEDIISDGKNTYVLENGDIALTQVTGTGCMSTSLIGSFLGAGAQALLSAIGGIATMAIAGENADKTKGYGTFRTSLVDAISRTTYETLVSQIKIKRVK
jgi:hydroxyethylthiazole kinase